MSCLLSWVVGSQKEKEEEDEETDKVRITGDEPWGWRLIPFLTDLCLNAGCDSFHGALLKRGLQFLFCLVPCGCLNTSRLC